MELEEASLNFFYASSCVNEMAFDLNFVVFLAVSAKLDHEINQPTVQVIPI